ncbi:hypothetical protein BDW02DRAFT_565971 [Decorospora gaudefroyi]|uniref:Uncharacterized protein n=1 Tax=Decorospora gaudefroyi TaxID=184978 RepID=A0A6A5KV34_9PLEO|nr:hypothetical protein BDW02DRAFT_565971 [Decorospora gaudefroyi]
MCSLVRSSTFTFTSHSKLFLEAAACLLRYQLFRHDSLYFCSPLPILHYTPHRTRHMPSLPTPSDTTHQHGSVDWLLLCIVLGIVLLQAVLILTCLRLGIAYSKARWKRLRQRGTVIVDGPAALIWTDRLPPAPTVSTYNLRQLQQESQDRITQ